MKTGVKKGILSILSQESGYLTAQELSKKLKVSPKTIYRNVARINEGIGSYGLIETAKGKGLKLIKPIDSKLTNDAANWDGVLPPQKRRDQITAKLLYIAPRKVKIQDIVEQYFVSESVINNDERLINDWLKSYQLKIARDNRSLNISGSEDNIRKAISRLTDFTSIIDFSDISKKGLSSLNDADVRFVSQLVNEIEDRLNTEIPYPYNVNIFSHIYILINRYRNVGLKSSISSGIQNRTGVVDENLYRCAEWIVKRIELYANIHLEKSERIYIYDYLESSRLNYNDETDVSETANMIAKSYIAFVKANLNCKLDGANILPALARHIRPMLNRLSHSIYAKNELLPEITREYPQLFAAIKEASDNVSEKFNLKKISDDENGFISIYFASEIERNLPPMKIIITCTTGVGTAELLKVKISRLFPELMIQDVISTKKYKQNKQMYDDIDLIVTTVPLKEEQEKPYVLVSALFDKRDQDNIRHKMMLIEEKRRE